MCIRDRTNTGSIAGATSIDGSGDLTMGTITMTGFSVDADGDTVTKSLNNTSGGITNTGAIAGATTINASGAITGGSLTDGTATLTSGALTGLTTALTVAQGGTGAQSLTDGGILLGSGTGAITSMTRLGAGEILVGQASGDPQKLSIGSSAGQVLKVNSSTCLLYTSPSPRDRTRSRMPSSA